MRKITIKRIIQEVYGTAAAFLSSQDLFRTDQGRVGFISAVGNTTFKGHNTKKHDGHV